MNRTAISAALLALAVGLTACGNDEPPATGREPVVDEDMRENDYMPGAEDPADIPTPATEE